MHGKEKKTRARSLFPETKSIRTGRIKNEMGRDKIAIKTTI